MGEINPHIGSSFESWLDETGLRDEVTSAALKAVVVQQLTDEMKRRRISKSRMAELMQTSRAARAVGRELRVELV